LFLSLTTPPSFLLILVTNQLRSDGH